MGTHGVRWPRPGNGRYRRVIRHIKTTSKREAKVPLAVGDHFDQIVKVLHLELETEWEVTQLVLNEKICVEGRSKANGSATVTQHVAADGDGSLVTFEIEFEPPFGILGDIADKVIFESRHERDAEEILSGLKTLCEGSPAR